MAQHSTSAAAPNNTRGAILIIVSMATFTCEDMLIKFHTQTLPVGQILFALGLICGVFFALYAVRQGHRLTDRRFWSPILLARAACEGIGGVFFSTALSLVDISVVAAVFQATPLVTTLFAAVFLREAVGWRRWLAIVAGFIGVLLIVRPGLEGFEPAALLVVVAVIVVATRDLITRAMPAQIPSSVISFQALGAFMPAGLIILLLQGDQFSALAPSQWLSVPIMACFGIVGYFCLVQALRTAETGAIMPFRYTRIVFSILGGMIVFAEAPDGLTLIGAAIILVAGLYTFLRERQTAR